MASLKSGQGPAQPAQAFSAIRRWSLPEYQFAVSVLALLAALALAWLYMVDQSAGMGNRAGTMGLGAWAFLGMWAVMVVAMMVPTVAPTGYRVAGQDAAASGGSPARGADMLWRLRRAVSFLLGYYAGWVAFGLAIYGVLAGAAGVVHVPASGGKWVAAGVYAIAGAYQFTFFKRVCRERCVSPRHVSAATGRPPLRSVVWESGRHALSCIGCCWAFMAVLIAVGLMNLVAMALLTVAIFVERHVKQRALVSIAVGVLLIAAAVLTPFFSWLHPGLPGGAGMPAPMHM